jgi:glycerophosphoryl diester phosphodiesterase
MLAAATRLNIPVHVWTIDDPAAAACLWRAGVTGIITNDPRRLVAVRDAGGLAT